MVRVTNTLCTRNTTDYNRFENTVILQLAESACKDMVSYEYIVDVLRGGFVFFSICITKTLQIPKNASCSYPFSSKSEGISLSFFSIDQYNSFLKSNLINHDMKNSKLLLKREILNARDIIEHVCQVHVICSNNSSGKLLLDYIAYCNGGLRDVPKFKAIALHAIPEAYFFYVRQGFKRTNDLTTYAPLLRVGDKYYYDTNGTPNSAHKYDTQLDVFLETTRFYQSDSAEGGYLLMKAIK